MAEIPTVSDGPQRKLGRTTEIPTVSDGPQRKLGRTTEIPTVSEGTRRKLRGVAENPTVSDTRRRGNAAEALARRHLQSHGVVVLACNWRCRCGELDLIGLDGSLLVIVEVRQRGRAEFGGATGSVTRRKQRRIIRATQRFLQIEPPWRAHRLRFDVFAVQGLPDGTEAATWIKDAFRAD